MFYSQLTAPQQVDLDWSAALAYEAQRYIKSTVAKDVRIVGYPMTPGNKQKVKEVKVHYGIQ